MVCECNMFNVEDTNTWHYNCQWKVNEGQMTMFEYAHTCRRDPEVDSCHRVKGNGWREIGGNVENLGKRALVQVGSHS